MKVKKEALRAARLLLKASMPGGRVDTARASELTRRIVAEKPRHTLQILQSFRRLLRLELDKRHAVIESAAALNDAEKGKITETIRAKYGADVTTEFKTNAALLGGLRVQVGSNVLDASVRSRLDRLATELAA